MLYYLAQPWTRLSNSEKTDVLDDARRIVDLGVRAAVNIYSPILYADRQDFQGITNSDFWHNWCEDFLAHCDALLVQKHDKIYESVGTQYEVRLANEKPMRIWWVEVHYQDAERSYFTLRKFDVKEFWREVASRKELQASVAGQPIEDLIDL